MYKPERWDLKDILNSRDKAFSLLKVIEKKVRIIESHKSKLKPNISSELFLEIFRELEEISDISAHIGQYSGLWLSADTKSQEAKSFGAKVDDILVPLSNRLLFFSLWWKDLDEKNAQRLISCSGEYRYYLEKARKFKPYTLSEPEEKVINIKDSTGAGSLIQLYELLKTSFKYTLVVDGKRKILGESEVVQYVRNKSPSMRKAAYDILLSKYKEISDEFGFVYQTMVRDLKNESIDLRGYKSPISTRNLSNDLPDEVIDTLLHVCQKNYGLFQRYFKLKAKLLGMKKMSRYHIYAPVGSIDKKIPYDQAVNMVFTAYNDFSPEMCSLIKNVFLKNHIDSEIRPNKLSGAFCASVTPSVVPYVLMNYTGQLRDVSTLAHELGHSVHTMLASKHSVFTYHSCLPLAETASVFGEQLLNDYLLEEETDTKIRINLLAQEIEDMYATIIRQCNFVLFEKEAHAAVVRGETTEQLSDRWMKGLKAQFGSAVEVPDLFRYEWLYIPHIFATPFYCYAYAFGNLLVLALYNMYLREGKSFVPKYLRMLSYGGSKAPVAILRELGIDPASEKFWQQGFDLIEKKIDEFEGLVKRA
ncbi:MAG: M3 family oligoendopeptidase [Candidatus Woesearchaeota archaeon]